MLERGKSAVFDEVCDPVTEAFPEVDADPAYKTPHICKKGFDDKRVLSTACKRPQTMKGGHEWRKYTQYRGLTQVTNWVKLKLAAMDLKKLAGWKGKEPFSHLLVTLIWPLDAQDPVRASSTDRVS